MWIRPNDKGTALDRERQLATLLEDDDVLCAHVYDDSGYSEFLFHGSPENIANFIGARPMVHQIVLTDRQERPVLWTIGYFIDRCPDKVLLEEVKKVLIPIQMRETEAQPFSLRLSVKLSAINCASICLAVKGVQTNDSKDYTGSAQHFGTVLVLNLWPKLTISQPKCRKRFRRSMAVLPWLW